ncbi:MAG: hypothetical protein HY291_02360 [Planctomycetes bacterium]|nr:hypothetical protein [Planctomycetota bacterium]
MGATVLRKSHLATFDFMRGAVEFSRGKGMSKTPPSKDIDRALKDLRKVQGEALLIGGIAVGHHGHERATKDIDILYANWDTKILERLSPYFKVVLKAESGWHHLEHRKNGVRLELIPEGGLTQYGFIPAPKTVGSDDGFITLLGLVWLKLVSGRSQDNTDVIQLAKLRFEDVKRVHEKLPSELRDRLTELLGQARKEMDNDPHRLPDSVKEAQAKYIKRKPKRKKVPA